MASLARFGLSSSSTSPVKAVLFDFDGTLWDPEPQIFQSYTELFREYGCVLPISLWSSVIGTIGFDLLTHLEKFADIPISR
jgi:beta-phosphoglucomutase-like phosphatase (HAD superfamily)